MNSDLASEQAEEIFCAASELSESGERLAFLDRACAGNAGLRSAVETLLAERSSFQEFFGERCPALLSANELFPASGKLPGFRESVQTILSAREEAGQQIGPYKLLERIGEGGCGVVYMAEQTLPVHRRVALKLIKLGMDTKSVIARFELERQAMALMDHPNIARVLDAGVTELGRPYVVMELVQGIRITTYCDQECPTVRQRLSLFIQVCHAIQHAHQKGIIHRDIKPSNILIITVDGQPVPKVIDFGIAKATGGLVLLDHTVFTAFEQFIGTPAYMSPEQAALGKLDVDTRSDIYSLGVLLYELLTGKTPFEQKELLQSGLDAMRRTLREVDPMRPSTRLDRLPATELTQTARRCQIEPRRLKLLVKGDLDWIVMKALEKERNRRYQTANGLAMDVQRYLDNEPVVARPPSRVYRLKKFARRNRTIFAAGVLVALALTAGLGMATWFWHGEREGRHEQARLREVAERARQSERRFRSEAEARATFAQALLLINRGRQPEAERLMSKIQMDAIEPSLDAAGVFRCLGEWKVTQGNWGEASGYFLRTLLANQVDRTDKTQATTWDLLRASPALVAAGSPERYHKFVGETLLHYSGTEDPVAAEQIIKTCLLLPADTAALRRLNPFAELVEKTVTGSASAGAGAEGYAWRTFSLGLFYYRLGDYAKASEWAEKSLNGSDRTPSRVAMVHVLLAMNQAKLGQLESARRELAVGQKLIEQKLPDGLRNVPDLGTSTTGYWHDWVMGQILLREASQAVTEKSPLLETGKLGAPAPRVLDTVLDFSLSSPEGGEGRGEEADGFSSSNPLTPTQVRALNP